MRLGFETTTEQSCGLAKCFPLVPQETLDEKSRRLFDHSDTLENKVRPAPRRAERNAQQWQQRKEGLEAPAQLRPPSAWRLTGVSGAGPWDLLSGAKHRGAEQGPCGAEDGGHRARGMVTLPLPLPHRITIRRDRADPSKHPVSRLLVVEQGLAGVLQEDRRRRGGDGQGQGGE